MTDHTLETQDFATSMLPDMAEDSMCIYEFVSEFGRGAKLTVNMVGFPLQAPFSVLKGPI